ncbi:HprK-related kinase B [Marinomonas sp. 15G1-11]|uniref:HprK-related kinase B n=1 Tax=Marinomonas phaeophyticola TaxID=3004091 RepID=A0ABT4JW34_9GAMM|nr:HprK-related kinase B [Marinomonas sp. 15G1-11]MCZ2721784.1 HprK-related kinase B [Marinomonas sp. 15G1-11]
MNSHLTAITQELNINTDACLYRFDLDLSHCHLTVLSNTQALVSELRDYFRSYPQHQATADIEIHLIESSEPAPSYPWADWAREAGKSGRKDSYVDIHKGRLLHKVRTGMVFFQSNMSRLAVGPCLQNINQVVNFINNQYMNYLQQQEHVICHAAAVSINGKGTAVAAFSGGGKSTLMLKLMDHPGAKFISNDRLFLKANSQGVLSRGVPKLPRINPGTILNNPKLLSILDPEEQHSLNRLPQTELWDLEQKYDVMIDQVYGENKIELETQLDTVLLLNWDRKSSDKPLLTKVNPENHKKLIGAIMKSPGPFYQDAKGAFLAGPEIPALEQYLAVLNKVNVYEVSGGVDFDYLAQIYLETA